MERLKAVFSFSFFEMTFLPLSWETYHYLTKNTDFETLHYIPDICSAVFVASINFLFLTTTTTIIKKSSQSE